MADDLNRLVKDRPTPRGLFELLRWLSTCVGTLVMRERNTPIGEMPVERRLIVTDFRRGASNTC